eukprot:832554-Heterocapsa_arctica.AAC.1
MAPLRPADDHGHPRPYERPSLPWSSQHHLDDDTRTAAQPPPRDARHAAGRVPILVRPPHVDPHVRG